METEIDYTTLLEKRLSNVGFYNEEIVKILRIIEETCNECWDSDSDKCTCMRDE